MFKYIKPNNNSNTYLTSLDININFFLNTDIQKNNIFNISKNNNYKNHIQK